MNITIIGASQRADSNSGKLANYIKNNISGNIKDVKFDVVDLSEYPFLVDFYGTKESNEQVSKEQKELITKLNNSDGFIILAPEWGGMVPPALINMFLMTAYGTNGDLFPMAHKPAMAVGVSASGGGTYPVSILRSITGKNSHVLWLPQHAIVQNVGDFLEYDWNSQAEGRFSHTQSRLLTGVNSLVIYAEKLKPVRDLLIKQSLIHPYGQ
ncbi:MAG: NAD(P)H-dependent oxidoreductase [Flavobacteriaceae bacterium]|nr:NAD(P)H-dependent oxidoreductase [Flavobacteriaceae bacterium]